MSDIAAHLGFGEQDSPGDKPLWAKCVKCNHCWPVAYLPMNIRTFAKVAKNNRCPRCGDPKPLVAKQDNGVLKEEQSA